MSECGKQPRGREVEARQSENRRDTLTAAWIDGRTEKRQRRQDSGEGEQSREGGTMEGKQAPRCTSSGGGNSRQSGEELAAKSGRRAPSTQRRPGAAGSRQQRGEAAAGPGCGPRQRGVTGAHREHRRWDGGRDTPRIIIAGMAMGTYRESSSLGWRRGHRVRKDQSPQDGGRGTPRIIIAGMAMGTYQEPSSLGWQRGQRHTQDHRRWDGGGD